MAILQAVLGALAAAAVIGLASTCGGSRQLRLYALGLVAAALLYVGFAAFNGGRAHLRLEALGLSLYTLVAVLGVQRWPGLLAAGWAGHALWDLLPHSAAGLPGDATRAAYVPGWYPFACIGFDLVVAVYLGWWLGQRAVAPARPSR